MEVVLYYFNNNLIAVLAVSWRPTGASVRVGIVGVAACCPSSRPLPEAKAPTPTGSTLLDRWGKRLRKNFLVTGMVTQAGLSDLIARCYCIYEV